LPRVRRRRQRGRRQLHRVLQAADLEQPQEEHLLQLGRIREPDGQPGRASRLPEQEPGHRHLRRVHQPRQEVRGADPQLRLPSALPADHLRPQPELKL